MSDRMKLRRGDGRVYLDRWGFTLPRSWGLFIHRMSAPDPGQDLHDHPWAFVSLVLWGGYTEERADTRDAPLYASFAERYSTCTPGAPEQRRVGSLRVMRLDECHRITKLTRKTCWTVVLHGPRRRKWGFYLPNGWMFWQRYDETVRAERGDLFAEISNADDPRMKVKNR